MIVLTRAPFLRVVAVSLVLCATMAGGAAQQPPRDPGPGQVHQTDAAYDWGWGELLYGRTYTTQLTITNKCDVPRVVRFYIFDPFFPTRVRDGDRSRAVLEWRRRPIVNGRAQTHVPPGTKLPVSARAMLSIPAAGCVATGFDAPGSSRPTFCQMTVPPGDTPVDLTIATPPPIDLSSFVVPPGFDPTTLFDEIAGELVAYHAGAPPFCLASREEYVPSGHIHIDPDPPPPAAAGPRCRDWWDAEKKPEGLTKDCTKEIRDLALAYRRAMLAQLIAADPAAWVWVPSEAEIAVMTAEELIAMKARASARMREGR